MKHLIAIFIFTALFTSCQEKQPSINLIEKGISYELAKYRKLQVDHVKYHLTMDIPASKSAAIPSVLKLSVTVNDLKNDLVLDFNEKKSNIKSVVVNDVKIDVVHEKEHLIIAKKNLSKGANVVEVLFDAGEMSLNRNDEFLYTLLVPDRASTLFPCFDQPDIKANYTLTITAPKEWKVLCGAFEKEQLVKGDFIEHRFEESDKMSTYLFSFVAGKFSEEVRNPGALICACCTGKITKRKLKKASERSLIFIKSQLNI